MRYTIFRITKEDLNKLNDKQGHMYIGDDSFASMNLSRCTVMLHVHVVNYDEQFKIAQDICAYLNKREEAKERATDEIMVASVIVDRIKKNE
jgi:hypothetical protein